MNLTKQEEQQQLKNILQSTFINTQYTDQQIGQLFQNDQNNKNQLHHYNNNRRRLSSGSLSDSIDNIINGTNSFNNQPYRQSFSSNKSHQHQLEDQNQNPFWHQNQQIDIQTQNLLNKDMNMQNNIQNQLQIKPQNIENQNNKNLQEQQFKDNIFKDIEKQLKQLKQIVPTQIIKQSYPVYLISQPQYTITQNVFQKTFHYQKIKDKNIMLMDVAYCKESHIFKTAIGTDQGQIFIFQQDHNKPLIVLEPFKQTNGIKSTIMALKWSANLQYLAVSNDNLELKVYQFKQAIQIQNKTILRLMKNPIQYGSIKHKKIDSIVIDIYFVSENPVQILCVDQDQQILDIQFKKHIMNIRPYIEILPVKFKDVNNLAISQVKDRFGNQGVIFAVGGKDFVTLCLLQPKFQIILVYDKQKHGPSHKNGFSSVSFRKNPLALMIVWDKFLQIININIDTVQPFNYNMEVAGRTLFPQSSIICGFLSNNLVYQISRIGCKIYSAKRFSKQLNYHSNKPLQCIHYKIIDFNWVPHGFKIVEFLNNNFIQAEQLRLIRGIVNVCNNTFFITTNTSLQSLRIQKFDKYVSNIIQNLNNWKVGLQILRDAYYDVVFELDQINQKIIIEKLKEYSLRYFGFLKSVIQDDHQNVNKNIYSIQQHRSQFAAKRSNKSYDLWNQQILFLFNILYETNQIKHLMNQILPKIVQIKPQLIDNLTPFILSKKIKYLSLQSFQIIKELLDKQIIKDLLLNIDPSQNQPQLPHQLNKILLQEQYYLEIIQINNTFGDQYTPFALMLAKYTSLQIKDSKLAKLIGFNSFALLKEINRDSQKQHHFAYYFYHNHKKQLNQLMQKIDWFLQLLTQQIYKILLYQNPQILFSYILNQLFKDKCLQIINSLSLTNKYRKLKNDLMTQIVQQISYTQVVSNGCEKQYWIFILQLYGRKIIMKNIWMGIKLLTSQQYKVNPLIIDNLVKMAQNELKKQFKQLSQETLRQFFKHLINTNYISLIKLMGIQLKQYLQVLHCMLGSTKHRNHQLYNYLNQICPQLNQNQIKKFKIILKQNISLFTSIDAHAAATLIGTYFSQYAQEFTDDLEKYPKLHLQLVEQILISRNFQASDKLKIKYLELLSINNKKNLILSELKKRQTYPIDESIQICKKYRVLDGYAYLLVKSGGQGDISSAIKIYFQILQKLLNLDQEQFTQKLMISLNQCIQICIHLDIGGDFHYQKQWFVIMDELQNLKHKAYQYLSTFQSQVKRQIINQKAYPQLVRKLVSKVQYQNIILHLRNTISRFDVQAVRVIINELVKNFLYQRQVIRLSLQTIIENQMSLRQNINILEKAGFSSNSICSVCKKRQKSVLIHYFCGHDIHPFCSHDVKQCIICSQKIKKYFQKQINKAVDVKPELYSLAAQGFIQSPKAKYKNKANVFQKLQEFDQIFTLQKIYPNYDD